jgi:hypothetical protein
MRLNVYTDPGVEYKFNHVYLVRIDTTLTDPYTGQLNSYLGLGKSSGEVSRGGKEHDQGPINSAVQSALNDLFGKIESDIRGYACNGTTRRSAWSLRHTMDECPLV